MHRLRRRNGSFQRWRQHVRNPLGVAGQMQGGFASQSHAEHRSTPCKGRSQDAGCSLTVWEQNGLHLQARAPVEAPRREQSPARWLSGQARLQPGAAPLSPSSALTLKRRAGGCHHRHHMIRYKTRRALLRGYTPQDKFNTRERSRSHWKNSWQGLSNRPLL